MFCSAKQQVLICILLGSGAMSCLSQSSEGSGHGTTPQRATQAVVESAGARPVRRLVEPVYPDISRNMNLKGAVQLQVVVRADGLVKGVRIIGGHPMLVAAAEHAVQKWQFQPGSRETTETVRITFGQ